MKQALRITEIFHSIQGESTRAGLPCVFVRLTGCNLRCRWCDTEYAFHGGRRMELDAVLAEVDRFACPLVEITGGEPLLQSPAVHGLAQALLDGGRTVLLETSGERDLAGVPAQVVKIVDVKCPGSGEGGSFRLGNMHWLRPWDEMKFVLVDRPDYDFARAFVLDHALQEKGIAALFSPAFHGTAAGERGSRHCQLDPATLAAWMLADRLPARLSLQVHKFIWDPARHGV